MPLFRDTSFGNGNRLGIWNITEQEEELEDLLRPSPQEKDHLTTIKAPQRRLHWLAGRLLAAHYLPDAKQIEYSATGQPRLPRSSQYFSIAHSGQYAALSLAEKPTGVDIELIAPRIRKVAGRFMHPEELSQAAQCPGDDTLLIYWCAKEALIKWCADPSIDFRHHIRIEPFTNKGNGTIAALINCHETRNQVDLLYEKLDQYMLVYTI